MSFSLYQSLLPICSRDDTPLETVSKHSYSKHRINHSILLSVSTPDIPVVYRNLSCRLHLTRGVFHAAMYASCVQSCRRTPMLGTLTHVCLSQASCRKSIPRPGVCQVVRRECPDPRRRNRCTPRESSLLGTPPQPSTCFFQNCLCRACALSACLSGKQSG